MIIALYRFTGDSRLLDKTEHLTSVLILSGTLKSQASIVNPIVTIEFRKGDYFLAVADSSNEAAVDGDGNELGLSETVSDENLIASCDYAEIPQFRRFYYINDVISVREGLWQLSMSCDVLMSFKDQIRELDAMVDRNQYKGNPLLEDDRVSFQQNMDITENDFAPMEGSPEISSYAEGCILMTWMYGGAKSLPSGEINSENNLGYEPINSRNIPSTYLYRSAVMSLSCALSIIDTLVGSSLQSFVLNFRFLPLSLDSLKKGLAATSITVASTEIKITEGELYLVDIPKLNGVNYKFDWGSLDPTYLDYSPYTTYSVYIPYKGLVSVDSQLVVGNELHICYYIGMGSSQDSVYFISVDSDENIHLIYSSVLTLGVEIPLGKTNAQEMKDQMNQLTTNYTLAGISGALSFGVGVATGHPLMALAGLASVAGSSAKYLTSVGAMHETAQLSAPSGESSVFTPQVPYLRIESKQPLYQSDDYEAAKIIGLPSKTFGSLSIYSGLTICSAVRTDSISGATLQERTEIEKNLLNGVIL